MENNLKTISGRKNAFERLTQSIAFKNKILIIGCGSIGTALLPLLIKFIIMPPSNITVCDKNGNRFAKISQLVSLGVKTKHIKITKDNVSSLIISELGFGQDDIIIDASYEINTEYMFSLCELAGISYINSAVEIWEKEPEMKEVDYTFYNRFKNMENKNKVNIKKSNNFIVSLGCNPGNVNMWTLYALDKINKQKDDFAYSTYAELAKLMGLRTIHVSEKDTQITNKPKRENEYVNSWASDSISWYDEAFGFLEISWGTHETKLPDNVQLALSNEYQIIINNVGCETFAHTYTPVSANVMGMLIRHEESYTICKALTFKDSSNKIIYKPSVYYIYKPNDSAVASTLEARGNNNQAQTTGRLMAEDIVEGRDEIGVTLFFADGDIYWIGSLLDIKEARLLYDNQYNNIINATVLQVVAGYIGGIFHLIESIEQKKYKGLIFPEDLPVGPFINRIKPMLGPFGLIEVTDWDVDCLDQNNLWQYQDFLHV
jgi:homospermidine synthase